MDTPNISMYATDDQQRAFVRSLTDDDLVRWYEQQEQGAVRAQLADDRASHDRGADIARAELQRRANS